MISYSLKHIYTRVFWSLLAPLEPEMLRESIKTEAQISGVAMLSVAYGKHKEARGEVGC